MNKAIINTDKELLEINTETGEILVSADKLDYSQLQLTKVKAFKLLTSNDFVMINGTWEAKRDALLKILTSLPVSYSWILLDTAINDNLSIITGRLNVTTGSITRTVDSMGICEFSELRGNGGKHFMNARAETRALKRAIETIFGSVINYYVVNYLMKGGRTC